MKHCPQCGAEYDDYVQYCFVDGVELVEGAGTAPKPARHPTPTPLPPTTGPSSSSVPSAPGLSSSAVPATSTAVRPALATAKPRTGTEGGGAPFWAIGLLLVPVILLFAGGGLLGAVVLFGTGPGETAQKPPEPTIPDPTPPPTPSKVPTPGALTVRVQFESDPSGAEIWEQDRMLCTTPCLVDHPDYAPPQRSFVLKLHNHHDTPYVMTDPTAVQRVELPAKGKGNRPRPRPNEDILIER